MILHCNPWLFYTKLKQLSRLTGQGHVKVLRFARTFKTMGQYPRTRGLLPEHF